MRFSDKLRHLLQLSPRFLIAAVVFAAVAGHGEAQTVIYYGGTIITYGPGAEDSGTVDAVAINQGKIVAVGKLDDVKKTIHGSTEMRDLNKRTMIPGFVDGHSHFVQVAYLPKFADLLPPPDGPVEFPVKSFNDIKDSLIKHRNQKGKSTVKIKGKEWEVVLGNGYDDSRLEPQGHPTREQLDEVSDALRGKDKKPILVCIFHQSGHYSACNSAALAMAGYVDKTAEHEATPNPPGGKIYKNEYGHLTGLLGESAHIDMLKMVVPPIDNKALLKGLDFYTSQGFTTVEDGRVNPAILSQLSALSNDFSVDVVAYADLQMVKTTKAHLSTSHTYEEHGHFRTGGVKLALDGSPQGRSAWFTEAYSEWPTDEKEGYRGNGNIPDDAELKALLNGAYQEHWQVIVHANGDAAIDQLIKAERAAQESESMRKEDRRTVLIHGQFLRGVPKPGDPREDQIKALSDLHIFPSLFPMHTFYWGDWYLKILGKERADFISPTKAVQDAGMMFSIHSDAPITKPNSMRLLDSAVNRTTRSGVVLGGVKKDEKDQRISPIVALKAMTIWPAYQHFEEKTKGSIEVGKLADFVILSQNPLTVSHRDLICIRILQTIKGGEVVYPKKEDPIVTDTFVDCAIELAGQAKPKTAP